MTETLDDLTTNFAVVILAIQNTCPECFHAMVSFIVVSLVYPNSQGQTFVMLS